MRNNYVSDKATNPDSIKSKSLVNIFNTISTFTFLVTDSISHLINKSDINDPIAKQFYPSEEEQNFESQELVDPIGDIRFSPVKGITHRYKNRLLLKPTDKCAVHCRFCFRRSQIMKSENSLDTNDIENALNYIKAHSEIWEIILSGGDPLMLSKTNLKNLILSLHSIQHVEIIRIHSRIPVVNPKLITSGLINILKLHKPLYLVIHCNHPNELTDDFIKICNRLVEAGIVLLSQTVLLKGINDNAVVLEKLFKLLIKNRIKPYYLHHCDLVQGSGHFRTTLEVGIHIMEELRNNLSGICQPTYVLDIPGGYGKVPIHPSYLKITQEGHLITDIHGNEHKYFEKQQI